MYCLFMAMATPLVDLSAAQITNNSDGTISIDDPGSPILLQVRVNREVTPMRLTALSISARHPSARINACSLARLPLAQILRIATAIKHPNDMAWQAKISTKPIGKRTWPKKHWEEVLDVYEWAIDTGRPGGGARAIADLWDVTQTPTAYRWINKAISETGRSPNPTQRRS